jgi:N-acyl-L-homoserine lactone synthetase
MQSTATALTVETEATESYLSHLFEGYRFRVAETAEEFEAALEIRREVYCGDFGYDVPVPDEYDHRSYLLIAECEETGEIVGTMRITPRELGPVEAEEYFTLPSELDSRRAIEISRFAIKRSHRKTRTFLPVVSCGLFKLCYDFALFLGADCEIVCSKAEKMGSYFAVGFHSTGITKSYEKLNGAEHELLAHDFRVLDEIIDRNNPFRDLFFAHYDEVVVPNDVPPTNLVDDPFSEPLRMAVGA